MNPIAKAWSAAGAGLKAASQATARVAMRWVGRSSVWWSSRLYLPGVIDYAKEVGDPIGSSIVTACVLWIARTFPEAPFVVWNVDAEGKRKVNRNHALAKLIAKPNDYYSGLLLWWATIVDFCVNGNAYWIKVRSGAGRVTELWYIPAFQMEPRWADDGSEYIGWYDYQPDASRRPDRYDPTDVVHFRYGVDPRNTRKGLSPFGALLREIFTDSESTNFTASLLRNLGIPGLIISPKGDRGIDKDTAEAVKQKADERFGGTMRGSTMVMLDPTDVTMLGYNPQQMDLKALRRIPEERISAVLGVPAIVAGLGVGLDHATYANMGSAREMAYEGGIIPMQRLLAAEIATQLLPDFDTSETVIPGFDLSEVRVLQDDQDKLYARLDTAVRGGWMMVSEARNIVGLQIAPEQEVFLLPIHVTVVPKADLSLPSAALPAPPSAATVTDVTPAKGRKAAKAPAISAQELQDASDDFDTLVDDQFAGLLNATVS